MIYPQWNAILQHFEDPEIRARIDAGIARHRITQATLRLVDAQGQPIRRHVRLRVQQIRHAFAFGAGSFMLDGYPAQQQNDRWRASFERLFNLAVVPFLWRDLEPQPDQVRFAADSQAVYRRPPPDHVLAWCRRAGLTAKGHNLIWHQLLPEWLPDDEAALRETVRQRFERIAERYDGQIESWDVVNEALRRFPHVRLPRNYLLDCFRWAADLFPRSQLMVNEAQHEVYGLFQRDTSPYYLMIQLLLARGLRVDGIGMQHHLFRLNHDLPDLADRMLNPRFILDVLDTYADFGRPIHLSEVTIPAGGDLPEGERLQATLARELYRTWFSHPSVSAIVWWNLADGRAYKDEGRYRAGLLDESLHPKPAYAALDELINHEWRTDQTVTTDDGGVAVFNAFHGRYQLWADGQIGRVLNITQAECEHVIRLPQPVPDLTERMGVEAAQA